MSVNKTSLLEASLREFFARRDHAVVAKAYLTPNAGSTSLRTIDWFITTYSRRNAVVILMDDGRVVDLHTSYKSMLKSFGKKRFDVFKRGQTLRFDLAGVPIETTLPQLNFFRWLIKYNVATYIASHAREIDRAMKAYFEQKRTEQPGGGGPSSTKKRKKRVCTANNSIVARVVFD